MQIYHGNLVETLIIHGKLRCQNKCSHKDICYLRKYSANSLAVNGSKTITGNMVCALLEEKIGMNFAQVVYSATSTREEYDNLDYIIKHFRKTPVDYSFSILMEEDFFYTYYNYLSCDISQLKEAKNNGLHIHISPHAYMHNEIQLDFLNKYVDLFNILVTPQNKAHLEAEITDILEKTNAKIHLVLPKIWGRTRTSFVYLESYDEIYNKVINLAPERIELDCCLRLIKSDYKCQAGVNKFSIHEDGGITGCPYNTTPLAYVENVEDIGNVIRKIRHKNNKSTADREFNTCPIIF